MTAAEKRFTRVKRIINAFRKKLLDEDGEKINAQFEEIYTSNNKSLAKLADVYANQITK